MNSSKTSERKDGVNEIGKLVRSNENGGETKHILVSEKHNTTFQKWHHELDEWTENE